jgi:hypothetical protein
MKDDLLQHQEHWRYCRVRAGEKKPYPADWQNNPKVLEDIDSPNIGLMLGPLGNGICAIDFDGTTAWTWVQQQGVNISGLRSVAWTSGKTDRCQMAFWVPEEYWDVLKTKKISTGEREGFEFRWAGGQSVLPPSIHPDTHEAYYWIIPPTEKVDNIPDDLLTVWLTLIAEEGRKPVDTLPEVSVEDLTDRDLDEVIQELNELKQRKPQLAYDEWRTVCWAVAHHIGRAAAKMVINQYYPEQKSGEYDLLFRTWNKGKSPTLGSLKFIAGTSRHQREMLRKVAHEVKYQNYVKDRQELEIMKTILKEKYGVQ